MNKNREPAMTQLHVVGRVHPNHFYFQYFQDAEEMVIFLQSWVPTTPLDQVDVVDSNSFDHIVVDSNTTS